MGLAEDGVVDFLADPIEYRNIVVAVLGTAVTLDGLIAFGTFRIELLKEVGLHDVIGIEDDDKVHIELALQLQCSAFNLRDGILQGLGLTAFLKDWLEERNGELAQFLIGFGLHVVGDDRHMEMLVGVVLGEGGLYGLYDDAIFVIRGVEDEKVEIILLAHGQCLARKIQGQL